jgi:hypothetical protein
MDFLVPDLLRILKPGRVAAIHVKDRILYGHQTKSGFMEVEPFSDYTVQSFVKHGFLFEGRRTVITDVVRENNSTYRLGWSEMCKDASKMGSGLPEYILLFRKPPSSSADQRADDPIIKSKAEYSRARWQVDAHHLWRSNGERPLLPSEYKDIAPSAIYAVNRAEQLNTGYSYERHVEICEELEKADRLPSSFMQVPTLVTRGEDGWANDYIWDDVNFMGNLNARQHHRGAANHLCPLPFDIPERIIRLYSNPGDLVVEPFAGLGTVVYCAVKLGRVGYGVELAEDYFSAAVKYCREIERELLTPTLFDAIEEPELELAESVETFDSFDDDPGLPDGDDDWTEEDEATERAFDRWMDNS